MNKETRWATWNALVGVCLAALFLNATLHAEGQPARDEHPGPKAQQGEPARPEKEKPDPRAQSGAEAADEARIYTAQLRRCEGLDGALRDACVEAAKRRLGQL